MRKLIIKGKTIEAIRLVPGETETEKYALEELAKYLGKLAGVTTDGEYPVYTKIDKAIGRDGFRIDVCEECGITITGGNKRGVLYGVYNFLEKYAGMKFYTPIVEYEGEGDIIVDEGYTYVPHFEYRQGDGRPNYWPADKKMEWCAKVGLNHCLTEKQGGAIRWGLGCHSFARLTDTTQEQSPCMCDPAIYEMVLSRVKEILAKDPTCDVISISQNDNKNPCRCERCAAVDAEEESEMGPILRFVNAIADELKDDYPDLVIETLAYLYSVKAPKITKPRPNVCIRYCTIRGCFGHEITDTTCSMNKKLCEELRGWGDIHDRIYIWDYVVNFGHYIPPFPNFKVLRRNMQFFAEHGVRGMYPEGQHNSKGYGEFQELRTYLVNRLMWNPFMTDIEYNNEMNGFLKTYYGEGWRYIRFFIDWTNAEVGENHLRIYWSPFETIPKDRYEAAEEALEMWWDKAEEMAGDCLENVQRSRMQWRYMKLMLHPDPVEGKKFYDDLIKWNITWKEDSQLPNDPYDFADPPVDWWDDSVYSWFSKDPNLVKKVADTKQRRAERDAKKASNKQ